jgi:hypothetical protein
MGEYLGQPEGLERLYAAHPGWEEPQARVALYGTFVRFHVKDTLERLFPLVRRSVGEERWEELVRAYGAVRPRRHFELNRLGEGFPDFVEDEAQRRELPRYLPALARFEWTDFAVYSSEAEAPREVERLTVNPTLAVLELPWRLCAYVQAKGEGEPEEGQELALLWRHPEQLVTMYMPASERALLALKMAVEGLTVVDVAAATGTAEADLHPIIAQAAAEGLVLAPRAAGEKA